MFVSYDGIVFDVVRVKDWRREAVYTQDKADFLYWEHNLTFMCLLNAQATAANTFALESLDSELKNKLKELAKLNQQAVAEGQTPAQAKLTAQTAENIVLGGIIGALTATSSPGLAALTGGLGVATPLNKGAARPVPRFRDELIAGVARAATGTLSIDQIGSAKTGTYPYVDQNRGGKVGFGVRDTAPGVAKPLTKSGFSSPPGSFAKPSKAQQEAAKLDQEIGRLLRQRQPLGAGSVPLTDVELRRRLRRPRRELLVWLYSGPNGSPEYMLQSPHPGMDVDAKTGPLCTIVDVPEVHGEVTAMMELNFITWEAPALEYDLYEVAGSPGPTLRSLRTPATPKRPGQPAAPIPVVRQRLLKTPALLSNRWEMAFGWDEQTHLRTQTIVGESVFRADVLHARKLTADQLRRQIWHPIPAGYQRRPVGQEDVKVNSAGDGLAYHIVDDEIFMSFPGGSEFGIIHVEVNSGFNMFGYDMVGQNQLGAGPGDRLSSVRIGRNGKKQEITRIRQQDESIWEWLGGGGGAKKGYDAGRGS